MTHRCGAECVFWLITEGKKLECLELGSTGIFLKICQMEIKANIVSVISHLGIVLVDECAEIS